METELEFGDTVVAKTSQTVPVWAESRPGDLNELLSTKEIRSPGSVEPRPIHWGRHKEPERPCKKFLRGNSTETLFTAGQYLRGQTPQEWFKNSSLR